MRRAGRTTRLTLQAFAAAGVAVALSGVWGEHSRAAAQSAGTIQVFYTPSSENFANPERGFYRASAPFFLGTERAPLTTTLLQNVRNEGLSLYRAAYVFDEFRDASLSQAALDAMTSDFANVRAAGLKIIPRIMYSFPCAGATEPCGPENFGVTDIPLAMVLNHIAGLTPVLQANADVIAMLEMGFVGAWGEWHHSTNGLVDGGFGAVNANSAAIVERVLSALPVRRATVIRTPHQKQALVGPAPLAAAEAFTGAARARIGAHNDCFLASESGGGTYVTPTGRVEANAYRQYLTQDNLYVPQTGETCSSSPEAQRYLQCPNALNELAQLRWSAINLDYQAEALNLWRAQGCFAEIALRLGYRLRLLAAELPAQAAAGGSVAFRLSISNDGWASPYNPRSFELVLRNTTTNASYALPIAADPRFWAPGRTHIVDATVTIPSTVAPGQYQLLLNLPDPEPALHNRPEYSIRLANAGVWEPTTGYNSLQATLTVGPSSAPGGVVLQTPTVAGSTVTLRWSGGAAGSDYILEAGTGPGLANIYNAAVGAITTLSANAPPGTYYVRVRPRNGGILGAPSNEVSFTVGGGACTSAPAAPAGVAGALAGGVATVTWNAVSGASYVVQAGPAPGSASFFNGNVGSVTSVSSPVGAGFRAYVRVYAVNACGQGPASPEILIQ